MCNVISPAVLVLYAPLSAVSQLIGGPKILGHVTTIRY
jgi:hypothetical protein